MTWARSRLRKQEGSWTKDSPRQPMKAAPAGNRRGFPTPLSRASRPGLGRGGQWLLQALFLYPSTPKPRAPTNTCGFNPKTEPHVPWPVAPAQRQHRFTQQQSLALARADPSGSWTASLRRVHWPDTGAGEGQCSDVGGTWPFCSRFCSGRCQGSGLSLITSFLFSLPAVPPAQGSEVQLWVLPQGHPAPLCQQQLSKHRGYFRLTLCTLPAEHPNCV